MLPHFLYCIHLPLILEHSEINLSPLLAANPSPLSQRWDPGGGGSGGGGGGALLRHYLDDH